VLGLWLWLQVFGQGLPLPKALSLPFVITNRHCQGVNKGVSVGDTSGARVPRGHERGAAIGVAVNERPRGVTQELVGASPSGFESPLPHHRFDQ
jgi:hypothetical protein